MVNIATKPMTEQYILGEMLNTLIEHDTDLKVELTQGVGGGTSNIEPGMEKGDFDLYPEYTGTGWNAVLKHDDTYDESMFDTMQQEYESQLGLTWVGMYGFNNTYGLAVSRDAAERYNLRTYSDLAGAAGGLTLGAEPDFFDRQDGYPGLQQAYGMDFGTTRDMDISLKYQALFEGQVDAIVVSTTDGQVADERLVVLRVATPATPSPALGMTGWDVPRVSRFVILSGARSAKSKDPVRRQQKKAPHPPSRSSTSASDSAMPSPWTTRTSTSTKARSSPSSAARAAARPRC